MAAAVCGAIPVSGGDSGVWRSTSYLASSKISNNARMGPDHIDDIRGATCTDEAPIPKLPGTTDDMPHLSTDDGMCPLVQEAFDGVGDVLDEAGSPLGLRRGETLANTVAFTNTGRLGNRRRKDCDDRAKQEGDGGELHCSLVL